MTTIMLADDHLIVREGLRALLEAEPGFSIVGEANEGIGVPDQVDRLNPEILIVDLMLPGLNGLEITRQVSRHSPDTKVIILSMHSNESYVLEALRNGAAGYVLKEFGASQLAEAIREVLAGRRYLSPPLSDRAIQTFVEKGKHDLQDPYATLTHREREVLQLAAEGMSNKEIADRLSISSRTVETHRANLMRKLNLRSQVDLIRYALRRGIIPMEQ
ncbi:MAG: response regulator [Anaerolineales bacterium]